MILYLSRQGALPLGKIGEAAAGAPDERDEPDRRAREAGLRHSASRTTRDRRTILGGDHRRRDARSPRLRPPTLNETRFATAPLTDDDLEALSDTLRPLRADEDGF